VTIHDAAQIVMVGCVIMSFLCLYSGQGKFIDQFAGSLVFLFWAGVAYVVMVLTA
jgi:hypothetical protein